MSKVSQILEGLAQDRIEERMASGLSDLVLLRAMYVKDLYNAIKKGNQKELDKWVNDYKADPSNKEELSWYEDEKLDVKKLRKELAEQEREYDRVHAQGRTVFGEGVKMYTEYKYHVMCDSGNGKPEVAAWYDDKKQAEKEAKFLKGKGYKVEIKVNEEAINEISRLELMNQNKAKFKYVQDNVDKLVKDKIDNAITKSLILRWIKGRNWEGGLGNGKDVNNMFDKLMSEYDLDADDLGSRFDRLCDFWEDKFKEA